MTENLITSIKAINNWFYWCYNYDYDFIRKVWADNPELIDHLRDKFQYYYDQYGSRAVMSQFYAELDSTNRGKLLEWVMTNYNNCTTGLSMEMLYPGNED